MSFLKKALFVTIIFASISLVASFLPAPSLAADLALTVTSQPSCSNNSVVFSWNEISGAFYRVFEFAPRSIFKQIKETASLTYTHNYPSEYRGKTYKYSVQAQGIPRILTSSDINVSFPTCTPDQTSAATPTAPSTVTIQGHFVDQNGIFVRPDAVGLTVMISGGELSSAVTVTNNPSGNDATFWRNSSLSPSAANYTVTPSTFAGYTISHATCKNSTDCARNYIATNFTTVNLPTGGNYADIYFKYTSIPTPTLPASTPTKTPTNAPTPTLIPTAIPISVPTPTSLPTPTSIPQATATVVPTTAPANPTASIPTPTFTVCPFQSKGDANCDWKINISDFNIWRNEMFKISSTTTTRADFNKDGVLDSADWGIWMQSMRDIGLPH